jgi:hypothetical protein
MCYCQILGIYELIFATNVSIVPHAWNYDQVILLGPNAMCYAAVVNWRSQSQGNYFR